MAKTYEELLEQAAIIRDETAAGKNTAERVGGTITEAVEYVKELKDTYAGIHAEAAEAKTEAAAAKLTAAEAKTSAESAFSNAKSAVLTANGASSTANEAKTESAQAVSTAQAAQNKNAEQDNRLKNAEEQNTKQNERLLNYVYPKLYQLNEGAGARVFNGFTKDEGVGSLIKPKETYRYSILYSTKQKQFVLNVTDEASGVGVIIGTFTFWPEIILPNGSRIASSESYALRDCLYYIYVEGEGSTYYYIDSNGVASEKSATYLLRRLVDKNASSIAAASGTANDAKATAEAAKATADAASTAAQEANTTATDAQEEASEAKTEAAAAKLTAAEAKTNAGSARSIAQSAQLTANAAKATADGIAATAQEAKDLAEATKSELVEVVGSLGDEDNRLNGLIAENKAKIASVEDTATKARDTAVGAQKAAENAQSAADAAKSELSGKIDGKQDALTLTVKDNGNIVLANIQGQSKEFMPATPSGDPMHYAFVTAGAEYNDTGEDIVKDAPWADMIDDDYTGDYGKTVVHKAGHWYLNGLGDITNEEIREIYYKSGNIILTHGGTYDYFSPYYNIRTMFQLNSGFSLWTGSLKIKSMQFCHSMKKCIVYNVFYNNKYGIILEQDTTNNIFNKAVNLIHSLTTFTLKSRINNNNGLSSCSSLVTIKIKELNSDLIIAKTPVLSIKSVLYMINNEAATSPITITLHADVYNRCMANEDILAALAAHTNISLASA